MSNAVALSIEEHPDPKCLPDADRIKFIRADRWINYDIAQDAIERLNDLLSYPPRDRMPCMLIYGPTGIGKTKIIRKFIRDNPGGYDRSVGATSMPVVAFQMTELPEDKEFYIELLQAMGGPLINDRTRAKHTCRSLLKSAKTRLLIIDEVHSMLAGTARAQRIFLNTLRFLANDIRIPLVCAGTDEARHAILTDSQLAERFDALELTPWEDDLRLRRLLTSLTALLPLRKESPLDTASCRKIILKRTDGITTRIFRLIETAAIQAIKDGSECITEESLDSKTLVLPLVSMKRKTERRLAGV